MLMSSASRYVLLFGKACGLSFIYNKNKKGLNIDLWGTAVYGPCFQNYTQLTFSCSKSAIETLQKVWNMFKLTIKIPERRPWYIDTLMMTDVVDIWDVLDYISRAIARVVWRALLFGHPENMPSKLLVSKKDTIFTKLKICFGSYDGFQQLKTIKNILKLPFCILKSTPAQLRQRKQNYGLYILPNPLFLLLLLLLLLFLLLHLIP